MSARHNMKPATCAIKLSSGLSAGDRPTLHNSQHMRQRSFVHSFTTKEVLTTSPARRSHSNAHAHSAFESVDRVPHRRMALPLPTARNPPELLRLPTGNTTAALTAHPEITGRCSGAIPGRAPGNAGDQKAVRVGGGHAGSACPKSSPSVRQYRVVHTV